MGTDIDPSFDYPLPIGGINILDFNFLNRNLQLALLYGGVIAFGNIQHANLWGGKFDASVDFFGLGLKANDDVFDSRGEASGERVNRIPVATGFNLGYQVTPFQKVSGALRVQVRRVLPGRRHGGELRRFRRARPPTAKASGYEYRRRGYSLDDTPPPIRGRRGARGALATGSTRPTGRTPSTISALSKDFTFATFHTIHMNGTYFGGQRLDRFSMYQFGLFDSDAHARRAVRRAVRRDRDGAGLVLLQPVRPVPVRSVPRPRQRARSAAGSRSGGR